MHRLAFVRAVRSSFWSGIATVLFGAGAAFADGIAVPETAPIPNFSHIEFGWSAQAPNFLSPPSGPHEVTNDPRYPYIRRLNREPNQFRIADLSNPILQPWAREELRKVNERVLSGKPGYTVEVSCQALGVPELLLYVYQPMFFIQAPNEVVMIQQGDQQTRRVYLNVPHLKHPKPSWYGDSVGHYEGDTLVVDTIGFNAKTWLDNYRTPHTEKLHVIERYHLIDGGKQIEVDIHIEDPGAFTTPWNTIQRLENAADQGPMLESPCAENPIHFGETDLQVPQADSPDF